MSYYHHLIKSAPSMGALTTAWIAATGETDTTIISALNTLETDLTTYGLTAKIKALYPMVGGTATKHKFNFMDARDLDAAYRLTFSGGWTHASTGAKPNGTNAYADTKFNASTNFTNTTPYGSSIAFSYYSRTNVSELGNDIGVSNNLAIFSNYSGTSYVRTGSNTDTTYATTDSLGLFMGSRLTSATQKAYKNGVLKGTSSLGLNIFANLNIYLGAWNPAQYYATKECAFASIGDGLSDTEAANFYTAVQAFQTTLGRSIGTQTVSDADAQAFVTAANITDQVQANAVNKLVIDLKAASIWTKMKAVYPMVGGTASSHKFNLVNPLDTDAAYRLTFNGGWTHSSTGALPNGTNAYADTYFIPSTSGVGLNSSHLSYYSRTSSTTPTAIMGIYATISIGNISTQQALFPSYAGSLFFGVNSGEDSLTAVATNKFYLASRINSTQQSVYVNSSANTYTRNSAALPDIKMYIGALNNFGAASYFNPRECAFSSMGNGLTNAEAANLYTAVQAFQTTLSRQV